MPFCHYDIMKLKHSIMTWNYTSVFIFLLPPPTMWLQYLQISLLLRPFWKATSWVDPNQTSKLPSYKATGIFRTHYLNFRLKQPWSDPNQINPTQNYKSTPIFNGFILSRSKSDFQTPKLRSYRHISNALPEFQTQTALNLSKSDQSNPKLRSYAHFGRQHLE